MFTIYDPGNGNYVKHWISRIVEYHASDIVMDSFVAGYIDSTTAIDEIRFKFHTGNIDSGTIKMYGIKIGEITEVS